MENNYPFEEVRERAQVNIQIEEMV